MDLSPIMGKSFNPKNDLDYMNVFKLYLHFLG